jgi:uncharacterized protein (TIGR00296 family)
MATEAHCAFIFETLSAKLQGHKPLTFTQVLDLWTQYTNPSSSSETPAPANEETNEVVNNDSSPTDDATYRPAAISRLLAPTPSSSSTRSSSVQSRVSTPSRVSEASSATSQESGSANSLLSPSKQYRLAAALEEEQYPLFVTYNVVGRGGDKRLRGCIGTFEPLGLEEGLRGYSLTAALDDTRFSPISARELPTLECGVTLLTNFEPISDPMDWEVGMHGLRISFTYHGRRYSSTYLPDVAREQGWTKEEALVSLMRKGGWSGRKDEWKKVELTVVRYQGSKATLGWGEYRGWREWVEGALNG